MIRITVELVSAIHPSRSKLLGVAIVANNGRRSAQTNGARGDYAYAFSSGRNNRLWRKGTVENFPRKSLNVWHLLQRCLTQAVKK